MLAYGGWVTATPPTTRRELNKARTREALLEALRDQLLERGPAAISVEDVAEAADVSRRTFFNYFSSVEAALSEAISVPIDGMATALAGRPPGEPPLVSIRRVLEASPLPREMLQWLARVRCFEPERPGFAVNVWAYHRDRVEDILRERTGDSDELSVSSLAGTVMAVFEAAERVWFRPDAEVDDASAARFNELLRRGLELAASGWVRQTGIRPDQPT